MDTRVFLNFKQLIKKESGISLKDEKKPLLENRIRRRIRELNLADPEEYFEIIQSDLDGAELIALIDAVSTNHTFFFREVSHFNFLKNELAKGSLSEKRRLRIWCAASSSGEEPYTILMTVHQALAGKSVDFKLLATDICIPVLETAHAACYSEERLVGISDDLRRQYFECVDPSSQIWQVKQFLRDQVLFKRFNLNTFPFRLKGGLDIIFCRNVMIYFERDLREKIVKEMIRLLNPGGILIVGHSEASAGSIPGLERVDTAVFRKVG
jgi:chemotaxis protein methyltransferase CheR